MTIDTYKNLGSLSGPTYGADTTIYTAPSPGGAIISSLLVANRTAEAASTSVKVLIGGVATVANPFVRYVARVPELGFVRELSGLCLGPGDIVQVAPAGSSSSVLDYTLSGVEQTSLGVLKPKLLGMVNLGVAGTATLYTVPAVHSAIVQGLTVVNFGGQFAFRAKLSKASGGTVSYLCYDTIVPFLSGGGTTQNAPVDTDPLLEIDLGLTMAAGDALNIEYATAGACVFCWGFEIG